jgi:hypothetical protein
MTKGEREEGKLNCVFREKGDVVSLETCGKLN